MTDSDITKHDLVDMQAEQGILHAQMRADWRDELALRFDKFAADIKADRWKDRLVYIGIAGASALHLPSQVTAGALAVVALGAIGKAAFISFTSN